MKMFGSFIGTCVPQHIHPVHLESCNRVLSNLQYPVTLELCLMLNENSTLEWSVLNPGMIEHSFVNPMRSLDTRKKSRWENTFWGLILKKVDCFSSG